MQATQQAGQAPLEGAALPTRGFWQIADTAWAPVDWLPVLLIVLLFLFLVSRSLLAVATPIEDAAMLFRYSHHVAQGYGVRWNIHEHPVDGATDFLFMLFCGLGERWTHLTAYHFSQYLTCTAHLLSALLIFVGGRKVLGANRWVALAMACLLLAEPGIKFAEMGFGAPDLGAMLLCTWVASFVYERQRLRGLSGISGACLMATCGLLSGLTRPEGNIVAWLMLLWTGYRIGWRNIRVLLLAFLGVFLAFGLPYFVWRWHYFGYPLPNPFYVKGNGHIYLYSVKQSFIYLTEMLTPVYPLLLLGLVARETRRVAVSGLLLLASFGGMWILLNNAMNNGRFQYSIVPAILFTVPACLLWLGRVDVRAAWARHSAQTRAVTVASAAVAVAVSMIYLDREYRYIPLTRGMVALGERLAPFSGKGYTMAVSEAGVLPYTSDWRAVDILALNDSYLAHHGGLQNAAYLEKYRPELLMWHPFYIPDYPQTLHMVYGDKVVPGDYATPDEVIAEYARTQGYTLAAAYGSDPCGLQMFMVRNDSPDFAALVHAIRDYPMIYMDSGLLAHDFRNDLPIPQSCGLE